MATSEAGTSQLDGIPEKGQFQLGHPIPPQTPTDIPKKYRLRPIHFGDGNNLYRKYFQAVVAKWISACQLMLGVATLVTEVMKMLSGQEWNSNGGLRVTGTVLLTSVASTVAIAAANRTSYFRLHSAMALHIVNGVVQYLLVEHVFGVDIPGIRADWAEETKEDAVFNYENSWLTCMNSGRNCSLLERLEKTETKDTANFYALYRIKLTLAGMTLIFGILQLVFSIVMALMSGRAICCGKMSLERKFYEIESLGAGSGGDVPPSPRPFPGQSPELHRIRKEIMVQQQQRNECENSDTSLVVTPCHSPLPDSSVTATPRSSQDVDKESDGGVHDMTSINLQSPPPYTEK